MDARVPAERQTAVKHHSASIGNTYLPGAGVQRVERPQGPLQGQVQILAVLRQGVAGCQLDALVRPS